MLAFLLGVVLGNVLQGIPLDENHNYYGSWLLFLNPYALSVGITTVALFMLHGAIYLTMKTEGRLFCTYYSAPQEINHLFHLQFWVGYHDHTHLHSTFNRSFQRISCLVCGPHIGFPKYCQYPKTSKQTKIYGRFCLFPPLQSAYY